jgi:mannose-6-phosphate isomerase-like protein (cupin superfamily)
MVRRRDLIVAGVASAMTLAGAGLVHSQGNASVMSSSIFEWTTFKATPTKIGEVRKVFQAPTATLDELECHITTLNAGEAAHPPHKHADEEIVIIKEGTIETYQDGKTATVGPGSIIFQASNKMHSVKNVGTTPATYYVFKWNSPGMLKKKAAEKPALE